MRRLTRVDVRSIEEIVDIDGDEMFDWPFLYAVGVGDWELSDAQAARQLVEAAERNGATRYLMLSSMGAGDPEAGDASYSSDSRPTDMMLVEALQDLTESQLNRWLAEALERHAPPASKGRRVKIRFMTQPSARPPISGRPGCMWRTRYLPLRDTTRTLPPTRLSLPADAMKRMPASPSSSSSSGSRWRCTPTASRPGRSS